MKHIKTLAFLALLFTVNFMSGQTAKTNWPKLNDVNEVAARIKLNLDQNNPRAFSFTETLMQQVEQLKASTPPANFSNKKTQEAVNSLALKTESLDKKAKANAPQADLKKEFTDIQALLASIK